MYKSERLELRLGPKDMELLDIAAKIQGLNRSALIRSLIRSTADWHQDEDVVASGILGPKVDSVSTDTPVESPLTEQPIADSHQHRWIGSFGHRHCSICGEEA